MGCFIFFRYFDHKVNNFVEKNKENRKKILTLPRFSVKAI